jgi:hypothetical protein
MLAFVKFWWQCARIAARGSAPFAKDWQWAFGNPTITAIGPSIVAGTAAIPKVGGFDMAAAHPILGPLLIAAGAFVVTWLMAFLVRLVRAPVELDQQKTDRWDLQHMLGGMFLDKTFMYGGDFTLCKNYQGKFQLELLISDFDMISVRAPRNSWAGIRFQFSNARQEPGKYAFYYLDGFGKQSRIENIYERHSIYLDNQSRFGLKLVRDEAFKIGDNASLLVGVESWTK